MWLAVRVALRKVLEELTLADVLSGEFPAEVAALLNAPDAQVSRPMFVTE